MIKQDENASANEKNKNGPKRIELQDQSGNVEYSKEVLIAIVKDEIGKFKGLDLAKNRVSEMLKFFSGGQRSVDIDILPEGISVDLTLDFHHGQAIHELSAKIREKIKQSIESTTGLSVSRVDVRVSHITQDHSKQLNLNNKKAHGIASGKSTDRANSNPEGPYRDVDQVNER